MKLVIIDEHNGKMQVGIDGAYYSDLDGSQLDSTIHAVQWNDTQGEVEHKDPATGKMTHNVNIDSIADFQFAIDAWNEAKAAEEAAIAAAAEEAAAQESQPE